MKKLSLLAVSLLICSNIFSQIVKNSDDFTKVNEIEGKVVFLREMATNAKALNRDPYKALKDWVKLTFGSDHFHTSIRYDDQNQEIIIKSRVELILPENSEGGRDKMMLKYRVSGFIFQDKCVLEIADLAYMQQKTQNNKPRLPKVVYAQDMITDSALKIEGEFAELRKLTKMSTLYFLNTFSKDLEVQFQLPKSKSN